uniref:NADH-ubiquinone oxidoreductase chain 2 n=1 Tax=Hemiodoecus leai TaxID=1254501 RepID=A0A0U1XHV6_9HEMI|nr:NADH dehydrogenase subunit 2 [Hemiodoecus leai]AIS38303.1 NADH dehydrogenase subunit 2 [Hemiodoecus leai]
MEHIPFLVKLNSTYILFMTVLLASLILISSSTSWLGMWMGLEVNLMSFIPLLMGSESYSKSTSSMKYFLIQSLGTTFLLIAIFSAIHPNQESTRMQELCLSAGLLMKLGSSPFHFWLPSIMENTSWMNCFLIMTSQKLGPIIAISNLMDTKFMLPIISLNLMVGTLGSLNQNSLRKLMAYSSINHTGWILTAVAESTTCWILYFSTYMILSLTLILTFFFMNTYFISQWINNSMKPSHSLWMITCFLSMGGLPPLIGFFPKWLILENILMLKYYLIVMMLITASLMSLFFYLRISFAIMFIFTSSMKMNMWKMKMTNNLMTIAWLQTILLVILPIIM